MTTTHRLVTRTTGALGWICALVAPSAKADSHEQTLPPLRDTAGSALDHTAQPGAGESVTWWLPDKPDELVLPIAAGVLVDPSRPEVRDWLRRGSPWSLSELPMVGARYGDEVLVVIAPSPLYAELVVNDRVGIRFSHPPGRTLPDDCRIVTLKRPWGVMATTEAFREWRTASDSLGAIPPRSTLASKAKQSQKIERLLGAPHFYLWGPARFSKHDVRQGKWKAFATALRDAPAASPAGEFVAHLTEDERKTLDELANAEWPADYLQVQIAAALDRVLSASNTKTPTTAPVGGGPRGDTLARAFPDLLNDVATWGDGPSLTMIEELHRAGIGRAVLVLSDLYKDSMRADVVRRADELGFLIGPYDSYHSVHSPDAAPEQTWPTAQFDQAAFDNGRVMNADGTGHTGFRGKGFHFSPLAAQPYVRKRVDEVVARVPYSAYFVDCDATAECFDDYSAAHPATRYDDLRFRRERLAWLESAHHLVVGSEGGSILFADVIQFGHGVQTPYLGHLDPALKDKQSPYFLGRYWPQDRPELFFKPVPIVPSLKSPYFDPAVRVPLYRSVVGEDVIATHHWTLDSMKFSDVQQERELLDVLYMTPPMYHLNRQTWPARREQIERFVRFWSPLHRVLGGARLTQFEHLSPDRLLQRATYDTPSGPVRITVNFSRQAVGAYPALSATVDGDINLEQRVYVSQASDAAK